MMRRLHRLLIVAGGAAAAARDVGYDLLVETALDEFADRCEPSTHPAWLRGQWVIPSVGRFELGERFVSILDAFGKLHAFEFREGEARARAGIARSASPSTPRTNGESPRRSARPTK